MSSQCSKGALLMSLLSRLLRNLIVFTSMLLTLGVDVVRFLRLCLRPPTTLAAENLFLRKQLALYQERHVKPRCATDATRFALVWLSRWFNWRQAIPSDHTYRFLIHDRDSIFSQALDQRICNLGLRVLKTPVRSPQANALCERLLGTLRRGGLGFIIALT